MLTRSNPLRAAYSVQKIEDDIVFIVDNDGKVSVTNDAEAVCATVHGMHPGKRIVYQDTMGNWDELAHVNGQFTGFKPWRA